MTVLALVNSWPYYRDEERLARWTRVVDYTPTSGAPYPVRVRFPDGRRGQYKLPELLEVRLPVPDEDA